MRFLATTCVFSESIKPRPHPSFSRFVSTNTLVLSGETLIDVQRGILRIAQCDPEKAQRLRNWLMEAKDRWPIIEGREREKSKILAEMLECRPLKYLWMPEPRAASPTFQYPIAIAAAAIAYDLPIAGYGLGPYTVIDSYFKLPGLFDARTEAWFGTHKRSSAA